MVTAHKSCKNHSLWDSSSVDSHQKGSQRIGRIPRQICPVRIAPVAWYQVKKPSRNHEILHQPSVSHQTIQQAEYGIIPSPHIFQPIGCLPKWIDPQRRDDSPQLPSRLTSSGTYRGWSNPLRIPGMHHQVPSYAWEKQSELENHHVLCREYR